MLKISQWILVSRMQRLRMKVQKQRLRYSATPSQSTSSKEWRKFIALYEKWCSLVLVADKIGNKACVSYLSLIFVEIKHLGLFIVPNVLLKEAWDDCADARTGLVEKGIISRKAILGDRSLLDEGYFEKNPAVNAHLAGFVAGRQIRDVTSQYSSQDRAVLESHMDSGAF